MSVGEANQVKIITCPNCGHIFMVRLRGFFIIWFTGETEFVFPQKIDCIDCGGESEYA